MAGFFDETYYLQHKVDQLAKAGTKDPDGRPYNVLTLKIALSDQGMSPEDHYKMYGRSENLNPNPYFNEVEYLAAKKAQLAENDPSWATKSVDELRDAMAKSGVTPAEHYEKYGAFEANSKGELLNPSNAFDANAYFAAKLVELQVAGVSGADTLTVTQVVKIFQEAGMSPVTHYGNYGAHEAEGTKTPLVQTVPSEQRVPNDPARTENVPGNYNPPTVGAVSPEAAPAPVAKPADVGAKVSSSVSPAVTPPAKPLPVPGDDAYVPPPANLVDTNDKPVVPPSGATNGDWAQVNPDGSADLIKPDGTPGGSLPPNSLNPADPSSPAPNPGGGTGGGTGGGGGGGGGGEAEGESAAELAARVVATFDSETNTLNVDLADSEQFNGSVKVHVDAQDKVTAKVVMWSGSEANVELPVTPDITAIKASLGYILNVDLSQSPSVKTFVNSISSEQSFVTIDAPAGYTLSNARVICGHKNEAITLADADISNGTFTNTEFSAAGNVNLTLGANAAAVDFNLVDAGSGANRVTLENNFDLGSYSRFAYCALEGGNHTFTNHSNVIADVMISAERTIEGSFSADGTSKALNIRATAGTAGLKTVDLTKISLSGFSKIDLRGDAVTCSSPDAEYTFKLGALTESTTIELGGEITKLDASAVTKTTVELDIVGGYTGAAIIGGAGDDTLDGYNSACTLTGGGGADTFRFGKTLAMVQTITDFTSGTDILEFSSDLFGGMDVGAVSATAFLSGVGKTAAANADQRFIYDSNTGKLYFDADGNDAAFDTVHIATLGAVNGTIPTLTTADFKISNLNIKETFGALRHEMVEGSKGKDKLVISEYTKHITGGDGDDVFLIDQAGWSSGEISDFSSGDKIGIVDTKVTLAADKTGALADGRDYEILNGVLKFTDGKDFTHEDAANALGEVAAGTTVAYKMYNSIMLFISDAVGGIQDEGTDCVVTVSGLAVPSAGATGVIVDANGFITGFTGA